MPRQANFRASKLVAVTAAAAAVLQHAMPPSEFRSPVQSTSPAATVPDCVVPATVYIHRWCYMSVARAGKKKLIKLARYKSAPIRLIYLLK
jgi:hypothetical protein